MNNSLKNTRLFVASRVACNYKHLLLTKIPLVAVTAGLIMATTGSALAVDTTVNTPTVSAINLGATDTLTVTNTGSISHNIPVGITNQAADRITNDGTITGGDIGIYLQNGGADITNGITNRGTIESTGRWAIYLRNSSNISGGINNEATGVISGPSAGIHVDSSSDVSGGINNSGTIESDGWGIHLNGTSNVSGGINNLASGTIYGKTVAIDIRNSTVTGGVINSGLISSDSLAILVEGATQIDGGITNNGGIIRAVGGNAIWLHNTMTGPTPININGGRIIGNVRDDAPANGNSDVTIGGDFITEGNFSVSDFMVNTGIKATISGGNTVTIDHQTASAGTLSFEVGVSSGSNGKMVVTNAAPNITGTTLHATVGTGTIVDGDEYLVIDGGAQIIGGPGSTATKIEDDSSIWSFEMIDGLGATAVGDNTQLYYRALFDPDPIPDTIDGHVGFVAAGGWNAVVVEALSFTRSSMGIIGEQMANLRGSGISSVDDHTSKGVRLWVQSFSESAKQNLRDNIEGYDADTRGFAIGVDTQNYSEDALIGLALSFGNTTVDSNSVNTINTEIDSQQITLYGEYYLDNRIYLDGQIGYMWSDNETGRYNVSGITGLTDIGNFKSNQFVVRFEAGREYTKGETILTPSVHTNYAHYCFDSYTSTGADVVSLNIDGNCFDVLELGIGVNAKWKQVVDGGYFIPEIRGAYRYDVIGDRFEADASYIGGGDDFEIIGASPAQGAYSIGVGATYYARNNWEFSASFDYELKSDYAAHSGFLRAGYNF